MCCHQSIRWASIQSLSPYLNDLAVCHEALPRGRNAKAGGTKTERKIGQIQGRGTPFCGRPISYCCNEYSGYQLCILQPLQSLANPSQQKLGVAAWFQAVQFMSLRTFTFLHEKQTLYPVSATLRSVLHVLHPVTCTLCPVPCVLLFVFCLFCVFCVLCCASCIELWL